MRDVCISGGMRVLVDTSVDPFGVDPNSHHIGGRCTNFGNICMYVHTWRHMNIHIHTHTHILYMPIRSYLNRWIGHIYCRKPVCIRHTDLRMRSPFYWSTTDKCVWRSAWLCRHFLIWIWSDLVGLEHSVTRACRALTFSRHWDDTYSIADIFFSFSVQCLTYHVVRVPDVHTFLIVHHTRITQFFYKLDRLSFPFDIYLFYIFEYVLALAVL